MAYITANCSSEGTDPLFFWAVSLPQYSVPMSLLNSTAITWNLFHHLSNGCWLSSHPSVIGTLWTHFFLRQRNSDKTLQLNQSYLDGSTSNDEVLPQEGTSQLHAQMGNSTAGNAEWTIDDDLLAAIVDANVVEDSLSHAMDDIIGAIADDEGDEFDNEPELFNNWRWSVSCYHTFLHPAPCSFFTCTTYKPRHCDLNQLPLHALCYISHSLTLLLPAPTSQIVVKLSFQLSTTPVARPSCCIGQMYMW